MSEARHDRVRKKYHILVEGEGIPPPIKTFKEMKFPAGGPGEGLAGWGTAFFWEMCVSERSCQIFNA